MTCDRCAATAPLGTGVFCSHCGHRMGDPAPLPAAALVTGRDRPWPAQVAPAGPPVLDPATLPVPPSVLHDSFARARRAPGFEAAMAARVASARGPAWQQLLRAVGFLAFGAMFSVLWLTGADMMMTLVFIPFMLMWLAGPGRWAVQALRTLRAEQRAALAYVRVRETLARPGDRGQPGTIQHRVTIELEDGRRLSLGGDDDVVGALAEDDVGVAYVEGDRLAGFRRLL